MREPEAEKGFAAVMGQVEYELRDAAERLNFLLRSEWTQEPSVRREVSVYMSSIVVLADMIRDMKMKGTPSE